MSICLRRRDFIAGLGGTAAAWPIAARGQQGDRVRRIGWLAPNHEGAEPGQSRLNGFKRGLANLGWTQGRNVTFEERWADGDSERLRSLAASLAASRPDLIFVANSSGLAAVRRATGTIPILFAQVADPVGQGFVSSLAQPGGNITGFAGPEFPVATKTLELLKKISPSVTRVTFMYDPGQPAAIGYFAEVEAAGLSLGLELSKAPVRNAGDIERAIGALTQTPNAGLFAYAGPQIALNQELIIALATRHRLPVVHNFRYFVAAGGLAAYGTDDVDLSQRAAAYADRILKGEKPADLPVQLPIKFQLWLNLRTAKAMGLLIPASVVAIADEVFE
jgi:putative ABC transport system substrate-binding protein